MSEFLRPLMRITSNTPLLVLAIILILAGIVSITPLGQMQDIARLVIAVLAAVSGIYVIYHSLMTRSKVDDFLGALFGMLLLGIAAYLGFGFNIISMFTQYANALQSVTPYLIAAITALAGIVLVTRRGLSQLIGVFLIIAAMAVLGVNLINLIKWW
ncbi:MAG: hypothetical protein ACXQTI_10940, partial [Candidatus Nezhaarchaeales archaeon]